MKVSDLGLRRLGRKGRRARQRRDRLVLALVGQHAASGVHEELTARAEVADLPDCIDDSSATTDHVQKRRKGALGRALLSIGRIAEPHRARERVDVPLAIYENNALGDRSVPVVTV